MRGTGEYSTENINCFGDRRPADDRLRRFLDVHVAGRDERLQRLDGRGNSRLQLGAGRFVDHLLKRGERVAGEQAEGETQLADVGVRPRSHLRGGDNLRDLPVRRESHHHRRGREHALTLRGGRRSGLSEPGDWMLSGFEAVGLKHYPTARHKERGGGTES